MDNLPDDVPSQETINKLVEALQVHRDTLVQASLCLKDALADLQSEQQQAVTSQLERYLAGLARGAQPTEGGDGSDGSGGSAPCR